MTQQTILYRKIFAAFGLVILVICILCVASRDSLAKLDPRRFPHWVDPKIDPKTLAYECSGGSDAGPIVYLKETIGFDYAFFSILRPNLPDDSAAAARYEIALQKDDNGKWFVTEIWYGQRCQKGRGHQNFSIEPCE